MQTQEVQREKRQGGIRPAKGRGIALLTPTLGKTTTLWARRLLDIVWPMNTMKSVLQAKDQRGGEVGEMRNYLVQCMMEQEERSGVEILKLFWLDDDVIPASPMILQALMSHDVPIASGVYFSKGDFGQPLIFEGGCSGTAKFQPGKVIESWGWAQGLCAIDFAVYKRMRDELDIGKDKYGRPAWYKQPDFAVGADGGMTLGGTEDFIFFERANLLGYTPIVDCTAHAFGWHMDLESQQGFPKEQFDMWTKMEPVIWPAARGEEEVIWS